MHVNLLPVTLFLLGTVVLCGAQENATTELPPNVTSTAEGPNVTVTQVPTQNITDYPTQNYTTPSNSTELPVNGTSVAPPTTAGSNVTESSPTTPSQGQELPGLSDGAIAGIVIGSIAGVGGVGAGVYGLLRYKKGMN